MQVNDKSICFGPSCSSKAHEVFEMSSYSGPKDSGLHPVIVRWANWANLEPHDIFVVEYIV